MEVITQCNILALILSFHIICSSYVVDGNDEKWFVIINNYALYEMVSNSGKMPHDQTLAYDILVQVCTKENIKLSFIDVPIITSNIRSKIVKLMQSLKVEKSKGGRQREKLIDRWKKSEYKLCLGTLKRKLECKVESERKKRKVAEKEVKTLKGANRKLKKICQ